MSRMSARTAMSIVAAAAGMAASSLSKSRSVLKSMASQDFFLNQQHKQQEQQAEPAVRDRTEEVVCKPEMALSSLALKSPRVGTRAS